MFFPLFFFGNCIRITNKSYFFINTKAQKQTLERKERSDTMISNQILQDTIDGIKAITRIDLCVMDTEGKPLASTLDAVEEYKEAVLVFAESSAESQMLQGYQFFKVFDENQLEYIILVKGETDDVYMIGKMASFQIQNLLVAYKATL